MSTVDSIMCGTPVLNIGFGEKGLYNNELEFIIESSFNLEFEKCEFVSTSRSQDEFISLLPSILQIKVNINKSVIINSLDIGLSRITEFV